MSETIITRFEADTAEYRQKVQEAANAAKSVGTQATDASNKTDTAFKKATKSADTLGKTGKKAGQDIQTGLDGAGKALGPLGGAISNGIKALKGLTAAARAFIATPIGAIIAAITLVLGALRAAFTSSEEGQNKWNKIVEITSAIVSKFNDLLADLGEAIISAFENPQQAIENFGQMIKDFVINRVTDIINGFSGLGKAIKLLFEGEFSEAFEVGKQAALDLVTGLVPIAGVIKDNKDAINDFVDSLEDAANAGGKVADMRAKADKLERDLIVERSKLEQKAAELRLKARQEDEFTAAQRREFLEEAQRLQDEVIDRELEYLQLRRDAQVLENSISKSNKDALDAEAKAKAAVNEAEVRRANAARSTQREINTLTKQEQAALEEQKKLRQQIADEIEAIRFEQVQKNRTALERELADLDKQKAEILAKEQITQEQIAEVEELFRRKRLDAEAADLQARLEQEQEVIGRLQGFRADAAEKEIMRTQEEFAKILELAGDNAYLRLEIERTLQDEIIEIERKAAAEKTRIVAAETAAKLSSISRLANVTKGLLNESAQDQQALALFSIAADTAAGIAGAVAAGAGIAFPGNLAAIAAGIASVLGGISQARSALQGPPSFDGGGHTGFGARRGGLDGKGGFGAILHPNEYVVDMTKPNSLSNFLTNYGFSERMSGATGGSAINWTDKRIVDGLERNRDAIINTLGVGATGRKRYKRAG